MNLAIAITASQYKPPQINLPACDCDADLMAALIESSRDFDEKLILRNIPDSAVVKKRLTDFISQHKTSDIEKVFFYFSGHADFTGNELFYLLSDYEKKLQRQTSLENSELDSLLRGLKSNLAVKVIDACHSGVPYIKDSDTFQNYIKGTKDEFSKCYFMFSSHQDQASYQNKEFSFFTRSFAEAIAQHSTEAIRLKDIIDFVSDAFTGNSLQTPFFVVQADFTETFCQVSEVLRQRLHHLLSNLPPSPQKQTKAEEESSLVELVKMEAENYCSQEEATSILEDLDGMVLKMTQTICRKETVDLYDVEISSLDDYSGVPNIDAIARWLDSNKHNLFVQVVMDWKAERYLPGFHVLYNPDESDYKTRRVKYPKSIKPSTTMPYYCLRVCAVSKFQNIPSSVYYIVPLVSETDLRIFAGFGMYKKSGWTEQELAEEIIWTTYFMRLRDDNKIRSSIEMVLKNFWDFTLKPLKKRFGLIREDTKELPEEEKNDGNSDTKANDTEEPSLEKEEQP